MVSPRLTAAAEQIKRVAGDQDGLLDSVSGPAKAAYDNLKNKAGKVVSVLESGSVPGSVGAAVDSVKTNISAKVNDAAAAAGLPTSFLAAKTSANFAKSAMIGPTENQLKSFASYNYILTLACLTTNEINFPDSTYRTGPPQVTVLRSGGGAPGKALTAYETPEAQLEYFIDEYELDAVITPTTQTRTTNATVSSFQIQEPYSMGLFLQTLMIAANKAGHKDYLKAPYAIIIEFRGYDDAGNVLDVDRVTRRCFPIKINKVDFDVNSGGSVYSVKCHAWNEGALSNTVQSIKQDSSITGNNVLELLQSGPESLTGIINRRIREEAEKANTINKDEYVIMFPPELISSLGISNKAGTSSESKAAMTEQEFYRSITGIDANDATKYELDSAAAAYDNYINLHASNNNLSASVKKLAEDVGLANDIGKGTIAKSMAEGGATPFGREALVKEPNSDVFTNDRIQISNNFRTFTFPQSTTIEQVIEEVVIFSSYGKEAATIAKADENGMMPWFRIHTQTFLVPDEEIRRKTGENPKIYVYAVLPFDVHSSVFSGVTTPSVGIEKRKSGAAKTYDYIYTGQNDDIIDFEINFNNSFFKALSSNINGSGDNRMATKNATNNPNNPAFGVTEGGDNSSLAGTATLAEVANGTGTGAGGGSDVDSSEVQVARMFNEAIVNNDVDLVSMELTVLGDPYYLADSGQGNYNSLSVDKSYTKDGTMNHQRGEIEVVVNFRTPIDYNESTGGMTFPKDTIPVKAFSGLYKVVTVKNKFSGGKFTQVLSLLRRPNQENDTGAAGFAADANALNSDDTNAETNNQNPVAQKTNDQGPR